MAHDYDFDIFLAAKDERFVSTGKPEINAAWEALIHPIFHDEDPGLTILVNPNTILVINTFNAPNVQERSHRQEISCCYTGANPSTCRRPTWCAICLVR